MKNEKRTAPRRHVRIPFACWQMEGDRPVGSGENFVCHDLSATGISFDHDRLYPIHSNLTGELYLPGDDGPLVTRMRVIRIESNLDKKTYRIGASFTGMRPAERERVVDALEKSNIYSIVKVALSAGASDIHLTVGRPPVVRAKGRLACLKGARLEEGHIRAMLYPLLTPDQIELLENEKELDFAFSPDVNARFRVNLHFQKGALEATLRSVPNHTLSFEKLGLPSKALTHLCRQRAGLILISGTTGSGKTTTMSSMVDYINRNLERVIITIENPIEFLHSGHKSIIKQRELGADTRSYAAALQQTLRQDPDVIVVGELTEPAAVESCLRAAETGHLVISTVHAPDTEQTVERIVNMFPPEHAAGISHQLASCLQAVLYQTLVPGRTREQVLATELMVCNHAIRNLVRERRFSQIPNCVQTGRNQGMYTLETCLDELRRSGEIDVETGDAVTAGSV